MDTGLEWWEEDSYDEYEREIQRITPPPGVLKDLRLSRQKIRTLAEQQHRNEQVLIFLWNALVAADVIGWDYDEYFDGYGDRGADMLSEDKPEDLVKLLIRDVDEFWSKWGTEEEKADALDKLMVHEFSEKDTCLLWRFYSSDVVIRRVWSSPAMNRDFVLRLGQCSKYLQRRSLEEDRAFMDSISFVLEDAGVRNKLHTMAFKAESAELMLWLIRSDHYTVSLIPDDAVVHVTNSLCLELLLKDKFDCNTILQENMVGEIRTVCAMHRIRDVKHVRLLRRAGFQLKTLRMVNSLPAFQLSMLLEEWSEEFEKLFRMEEILNQAEFPHEYVQVSPVCSRVLF